MNNRKVLSTREVEKILRKNGYKYKKHNGSHIHYEKDGNVIVITNNINAMVWRRLKKENNIFS